MKYRAVLTPRSRAGKAAYEIAQDQSALEGTATLAHEAGFSEQQVEAGRNSAFEGIGTLDARVAIHLLPRAVAMKMLPFGIELAPQPICPPDRHPVFFLFSDDHFEAWFGNMDYHEMMVGVPFVQLADPWAPNRGPFIYMPRLYLDDALPRLLGNTLYGFEKLAAGIAITTNDSTSDYVVTSGPHELARLRWRAQGDPEPAAEFPNFEVVRRLFEMPTISQASRIFDDDAFEDRDHISRFLATTISYAFDDDACTIQPIETRMTLGDRVTPRGLPTTPLESSSIVDAELGSFRVKVPQVVSLPHSCVRADYPPPTPGRRQRVVVLGGGPSACAAAYYLARQTDRYDVTLYTQGWRLGGKCAAGRNPDASWRIEEHGLHAFPGFYQNAFRTVREVYETAGIDVAIGEPPYNYAAGEGPVAGAFVGEPEVGVYDRWNDAWYYFPTPQEFNDETPGEIPDHAWDYPPFFTKLLVSAMRQIVADMVDLIGFDDEDDEATVNDRFRVEREALPDGHESWWDGFVNRIENVLDIDDLSVRGMINGLVDFIEDAAIEHMAEEIEDGSVLYRGLSWLLKSARKALKVVYRNKIKTDREKWFTWTNLDLVLTTVIGIVDDKAVDFDALDDVDYRAWLLGHGLDEDNAQIGSINQVYETLFAHGWHDAVPDELPAGVALRWFALVGFLYSGFPAYDFKYSCPQTLLTPYYIALRRLGAKVRFFHRVDALSYEHDDAMQVPRLSAISMKVQARVVGGPDAYDPFLPDLPDNPPDRPAWPVQPHWDQLEDGDALRAAGANFENAWDDTAADTVELRQGRDADFDVCVLGIPVAALKNLVAPLTAPDSPTYSPPWKRMMDSAVVTQTLSAQLWLKKPADDLFEHEVGLLTSYALPEPSFADFSHLLALERWEGAEPAKFLGYHTGSRISMTVDDAFPDASPDLDAVQSTWRTEFRDWLEAHAHDLYRGTPPDFDGFLDELAIPHGHVAVGEDRLWAQFMHATVQPSDLYTLAHPTLVRNRLAPSDGWVRHLFVCGDWTRTDLNCGSVEASTQSGMLAARVISNYPTYVWHPGF